MVLYADGVLCGCTVNERILATVWAVPVGEHTPPLMRYDERTRWLCPNLRLVLGPCLAQWTWTL